MYVVQYAEKILDGSCPIIKSKEDIPVLDKTNIKEYIYYLKIEDKWYSGFIYTNEYNKGIIPHEYYLMESDYEQTNIHKIGYTTSCYTTIVDARFSCRIEIDSFYINDIDGLLFLESEG